MNNLNKFFTVIVSSIIIFSSIFLLFINKDKLTDQLGIRFLIIKSGSMYPELDINDIVMIKKSNQYKAGDIITYDYKNQYLITHRIIGKQEGYFITKGDYNNSEDEEKVEFKNIKGKVIFILKNKYLKNVIMIALIITLIKIFRKGKCNEKNN